LLAKALRLYAVLMTRVPTLCGVSRLWTSGPRFALKRIAEFFFGRALVKRYSFGRLKRAISDRQ
jgi:hypothetical protein